MKVKKQYNFTEYEEQLFIDLIMGNDNASSVGTKLNLNRQMVVYNLMLFTQYLYKEGRLKIK